MLLGTGHLGAGEKPELWLRRCCRSMYRIDVRPFRRPGNPDTEDIKFLIAHLSPLLSTDPIEHSASTLVEVARVGAVLSEKQTAREFDCVRPLADQALFDIIERGNRTARGIVRRVLHIAKIAE